TGAKVIIGGDLLDAMQSRHDPRRSFAGLKPELARDDYVDALVDYALQVLKPYKSSIAAICDGNHETHIAKLTQSYVLERIARALGCEHLPYRTLITVETDGREWRIWYAHGAGTHHAPVTLGVIDVARQMAYADADVIWNGHTHSAYAIPLARVHGDTTRLVWAIRTPSYLRWRAGSAWQDERGFAPQPRGCALLRFDGESVSAQLLVKAN
ncbi:MAG: hypothetical protein N2545_12000, partial [Thermoflexales bacterium]|nr:hypothetical protein [Thermoflexales bacterium]